jgi:hypothetical protein
MVSPNLYIKVLTSVLQNITLYRNKVTADIICKDKVFGVGPKPLWLVSLKQGELWPQRPICTQGEGKDRVNLLQAKEHQRSPANHKELAERGT